MNTSREAKLLKIILAAYPDRVTVRRAGDAARGVMVGGRGVVLEPASVVRTAPLFLSLDPRDAVGPGAGTRKNAGGASVGAGRAGAGDSGAAAAGAGEAAGESRVSIASAIEFEWLGELFPHLIERRVEHRFDAERGRVVSLRQTLFAGLAVREEPAGPKADPEGAQRALYEYLTRAPGGAEAFFRADEAAAQWLARVRFLARHMPELEWPEFGESALAEALREACAGCTSLDQVRARHPARLLENKLSWRQRAALDEHAPEALAVPSGSRIRLRYPEGGAPPILAVRLQELFGLAETPRLAAGRAPVVLHLLGPNYRPVQVTSDLRSFWNTTYKEVRRDLRARYPKHPWPEDPWNAPPVSVGRRRRG